MSENIENANPQFRSVYENENANKIPILFMIMGLAGSGKSYIADGLGVSRNGVLSKPIIHSSNELREELYKNVNDQTHNQDLFVELHKRIKNDLRNNKDVIYDATNINKKRRRAFLEELNKINCHKVCICVMTPYEVCLVQNTNRERRIPEEVIKRMYMNWNPPSLNEGFNDIIIAYNYGDINPSSYTLDNFFSGDINADEISQENHHHTYTIGQHCKAAARYIAENYPINNPLVDEIRKSRLTFAALTHDIGKVFTKTHINAKGENDGECHFYQHQCTGAYDILFYAKTAGIDQCDALYISNLIYYHMNPFLSWRQSKKAELRDRKQMGELMYQDLLKLHEADLAAH